MKNRRGSGNVQLINPSGKKPSRNVLYYQKSNILEEENQNYNSYYSDLNHGSNGNNRQQQQQPQLQQPRINRNLKNNKQKPNAIANNSNSKHFKAKNIIKSQRQNQPRQQQQQPQVSLSVPPYEIDAVSNASSGDDDFLDDDEESSSAIIAAHRNNGSDEAASDVNGQIKNDVSSIMVAVRVRPLLQKEIETDCKDIIRVMDQKAIKISKTLARTLKQ